MSIRACVLDLQQANDIVKLAEEGAKRDQIIKDLAEYLSAGGRNIIPPQDAALATYATALTQSIDLRELFLEYALLRGASCLSTYEPHR